MPRVVNLDLMVSDECRGKGTEGDPLYRVYQLFTKDGRLVCEAGPFFNEKQHMYADYDYIAGFDRCVYPVEEKSS